VAGDTVTLGAVSAADGATGSRNRCARRPLPLNRAETAAAGPTLYPLFVPVEAEK